ncbi:MAG: aspartate carbamoyltransferase catalytic subunit [Spirochaetes bacterium]|nr:aspartate carbamoyltransferase catalytic subunit [Spirochaetota bacterium]
MRHLIDLESISKEDIIKILDTAKSFKEIFTRDVKKVPALRGKTVVNLFFEASTRTRNSFELAAKRLSADVLNFNVSSSSVSKGESLIDTAKTIEAMASDFIVIRHPSSGAAKMLSRHVKSAVINAGDGTHAHPTQALLDIFTMREKKLKIKNLHVAIVGDILHSRVARSNLWGLLKLGAKVTLVGPPTLVPRHFSKLGVEISYNMDKTIQEVDVVNMLRIQKERQDKNYFPSIMEYARSFGMNEKRMKIAKKDLLIMHPGPMNRDIEISSSIADGPNSVINEQVTNGVAVRMAVLYLLSGGDGKFEDPA